MVFPGYPVSSTNKTDREGTAEILLNVALNTINQQEKVVEGGNIDTPNTEIPDRKLSRFGKVKLILSQSCWIKLVLWTQNSSLSEMSATCMDPKPFS
jgi:hypothetical protein